MPLICLDGSEYEALGPRLKITDMTQGTWFGTFGTDAQAFICTKPGFYRMMLPKKIGPEHRNTGNYTYPTFDFKPRTLDGTDLLRRI